MKTVKEYTASMVSVAPQIVKNDNPTGPGDLLAGDASHFYNSLLSAIGLNLTIRSHFEVGSCTNMVTGNCTGLRADLQFGLSDFSVIALPADDYDYRAPLPIIHGPYLYDAFLRFGGVPDAEGREYAISAFFTFTQIPGPLYIFAAFVLFSSCLLINWSPARRTLQKRISWIVLICMMTIHGHPHPPILTRRRFALLACTLMSFFFYQIYQASSTCDRISVTPPYYLSSVREVAKSNRTALLFKGHITYLTYKDHADWILRKMVRTAKLFDAGQPDTFSSIASDVMSRGKGISFGNEIVVQVIQCFICFNTEYSTMNPVRFGKPFKHSLGYATYHKNIDLWLRRHLDQVFYRFTESGLYEKQNKDPVPKVSSIMNPEKLRMCLIAMESRPDNEFRFEKVTFKSFQVILRSAFVANLVAVVAVAGETLLARIGRRRRHKGKKTFLLHETWNPCIE